MVGDLDVHATIPASDIERARLFYEEKLDLKAVAILTDGSLLYRCDQSSFLLYPSMYAGSAKNTAMEWTTDNIERDVEELRKRGVVFEEYDLPGVKTVNGIAEFAGDKSAWFKDSEGNILAFGQVEAVSRSLGLDKAQ